MSAIPVAEPALRVDLKIKNKELSMSEKLNALARKLEDSNKEVQDLRIEIFTFQLKGAELHDVWLV